MNFPNNNLYEVRIIFDISISSIFFAIIPHIDMPLNLTNASINGFDIISYHQENKSKLITNQFSMK